ncbi:MAG TPA: hypothetical protein VD907_00435 [Verrucomicrobiae bacterium]|nr:hypothetical protein [Verrucomicrobiae bacterium]
MQTSHDIEPVTVNEIVGLASWDRERSDDELRAFIERHDAALDEDFESFEEELFQL